MNYAIETTYYASTLARITLPDDHTWDDIADWYIKWDTLHYVLIDETEWKSIDLDSQTDDMIDWKRPNFVSVFPVTEDGLIEYNNEVAERDGPY